MLLLFYGKELFILLTMRVMRECSSVCVILSLLVLCGWDTGFDCISS